MGKKGKGSNIIFLIILRLLGRISSGEEDGNFGKENQDFKNEVREEYQLIGNFIHPLYRLLHSMSWTAGVSLEEAKYLLVIPFHHLGVVHLAINLLSFYVKGRRLELQFGVYKLVVLVASCILSTSFIHCILNREGRSFRFARGGGAKNRPPLEKFFPPPKLILCENYHLFSYFAVKSHAKNKGCQIPGGGGNMSLALPTLRLCPQDPV